jgi:hypothetical protein
MSGFRAKFVPKVVPSAVTARKPCSIVVKTFQTAKNCARKRPENAKTVWKTVPKNARKLNNRGNFRMVDNV